MEWCFYRSAEYKLWNAQNELWETQNQPKYVKLQQAELRKKLLSSIGAQFPNSGKNIITSLKTGSYMQDELTTNTNFKWHNTRTQHLHIQLCSLVFNVQLIINTLLKATLVIITLWGEARMTIKWGFVEREEIPLDLKSFWKSGNRTYNI